MVISGFIYWKMPLSHDSRVFETCLTLKFMLFSSLHLIYKIVTRVYAFNEVLPHLSLRLTSNIFPVLKKPAFFSLLRANRTFRVTLPSFSSNTKPSPYLEGPGEPAGPPALPRSRRASSIRLCFLPLKVCTTPSVFISVGAESSTGLNSLLSSRGCMEMSCLEACFASRRFFYLWGTNIRRRRFRCTQTKPLKVT